MGGIETSFRSSNVIASNATSHFGIELGYYPSPIILIILTIIIKDSKFE